MNQKTISLGLCITIVFACGGIVLPQTAGAGQPESPRMEIRTSEGPAPLDASEMESYSQLEEQAAEDGALDQVGAGAGKDWLFIGILATTLLLIVAAAG